MASRTELQTFLEELIGSRNVYFQPPASIQMSYPAIVYSRNDIENSFANNNVYNTKKSYEIIVIDKKSESALIEKLTNIKHCRYNRHYVSDNLHHDVFILYF